MAFSCCTHILYMYVGMFVVSESKLSRLENGCPSSSNFTVLVASTVPLFITYPLMISDS